MKSKKLFAFTTSLAIFSTGLFGLIFLRSEVEAAGVAVTLNPSEIATSNSASKQVIFTPSVGMTNGSTITVYYPSAYTDTSLVSGNLSITKTGDANFTSGSFSVDTTNNFVTATLTTSGTLDTSNAFTISFTTNLVAPASAGIHSYAVTTSAGDFGAALQYVGDDNDVTVTATVLPTLSMNIRLLDDSADTNTCDLGNVSTLTAVNLDLTDDGVGECGYALAVGTNSASGMTLTVTGSANGLYNGSHTMANVSGAFGTGTEEYGFANVTAATGVTIDATYVGANGYPILTSADVLATSSSTVSYTAAGGATDTTRVMHGLTIGSATPTGNYTQTMTYTVTASF